MGEMRVIQFVETPGHQRPGGTTTIPVVGHWMGAQGFSTGFAVFPAASVTAWHSHNVEEAFIAIDGEVQFEGEGETHQLRRYDTVYVPAGVGHRIINPGDRAVQVLWIYATTNVTRTFLETGKTVQHLSAEDLAGGAL